MAEQPGVLRIAIASGKGGTGKTTVAACLAQLSCSGLRTRLLDCDVEGPNAHLFFPGEFTEQQPVEIRIPRIDEGGCTACGECAAVCQYHAIVLLKSKPVVFPDLCHGCGSCSLVCPESVIQEVPRQIGLLQRGQVQSQLTIQQGELDIGQPLAVPVIAELKSWDLDAEMGFEVIDAPPGASCPVVEAVREADFVLLVTEPTPFGLHDLKQAHQVTREMGLPAGVIINRDGVGDQTVDRYCQQAGLPILMRIPLAEQYARGLAVGKTLLEIDPSFHEPFQYLLETIRQAVATGVSS